MLINTQRPLLTPRAIEKIGNELFPDFNEKMYSEDAYPSDRYRKLNKEIMVFYPEVRTDDDLRRVVSKHLKAALQYDKEMACPHKAFFTHIGLLRYCLRLEYGERNQLKVA